MNTELPDMKIQGRVGDYFSILEEEHSRNEHQRVILFLGSNLGNLNQSQSHDFISKICEAMEKGDKLVLFQVTLA